MRVLPPHTVSSTTPIASTQEVLFFGSELRILY